MHCRARRQPSTHLLSSPSPIVHQVCPTYYRPLLSPLLPLHPHLLTLFPTLYSLHFRALSAQLPNAQKAARLGASLGLTLHDHSKELLFDWLHESIEKPSALSYEEALYDIAAGDILNTLISQTKTKHHIPYQHDTSSCPVLQCPVVSHSLSLSTRVDTRVLTRVSTLVDSCPLVPCVVSCHVVTCVMSSLAM